MASRARQVAERVGHRWFRCVEPSDRDQPRPLLLHLFGTAWGLEAAAVFAVFTSQAWNMTFSFYHSLKTEPTDLDEAARLYRLTNQPGIRCSRTLPVRRPGGADPGDDWVLAGPGLAQRGPGPARGVPAEPDGGPGRRPGGIPVVRDAAGALRGVQAVVDKDLTAALLGNAGAADLVDGKAGTIITP